MWCLTHLSITNQTIKLGGGLRQECDSVSVIKAGKLRFSKPNECWVLNTTRSAAKKPKVAVALVFGDDSDEEQ
ncbi:hypothetical protein WN943_003351 [Citrus x changshan-huyou]